LLPGVRNDWIQLTTIADYPPIGEADRSWLTMNSTAMVSIVVQELVEGILGLDLKLLRANEIVKARGMQLEVEKHGRLGFETKRNVESERDKHYENQVVRATGQSNSTLVRRRTPTSRARSSISNLEVCKSVFFFPFRATPSRTMQPGTTAK
jgi:hypothetical protein